MTGPVDAPEPPPEPPDLPPPAMAVVDRSGLTDAELEPKAPSRLGRRLRWVSGGHILLITLIVVIVVPLILAVALDPLIRYLNR